jgi:hypothetical protein
VTAPSGGVYGCCRADGTCGADLYALGLGCVPAANGVVAYCGPGTGGFVSSGGFPGTGGFVSFGGFPGTGGFVSFGGFPGTGGFVSSGGALGTGAISGNGGATADQCAAQATTPCEKCACTACFDAMVACYVHGGCPDILHCANQTGCTGVDCYQPSTCQSVIDRWGGPLGDSTSLAMTLFSCLSGSACDCGFGP